MHKLIQPNVWYSFLGVVTPQFLCAMPWYFMYCNFKSEISCIVIYFCWIYLIIDGKDHLSIKKAVRNLRN